MKDMYTSDGRKVRVVGKLNAKETIVQEVYCDNAGAEIPSGENFVVKSLHGSPVKSWKQKEVEKWENTYTQSQDRLVKERKRLEETTRRVASTIRAVEEMDKFFSADKFSRLALFMSGGITHYLFTQYTRIKIVRFTEATCDRSLKLLTLYGTSKGELQWRLGDYSDGSGGSTEIVPCTSYEDALEKAQAFINEKAAETRGVGADLVESAKKYGLTIPPEAMGRFRASKVEATEKMLATTNARAKELKAEIKALKKN